MRPWLSLRSGVNVKTRKRNIVVPEDPGSFADAVVTLCQDAAEGVSLEADLEAAAKALNENELEYSRYGEILFQVFFAGGRLGTGAQLAAEDTKRLSTHVRRAAGGGGDLGPKPARPQPGPPCTLLTRCHACISCGDADPGVPGGARGLQPLLEAVPVAHQVTQHSTGRRLPRQVPRTCTMLHMHHACTTPARRAACEQACHAAVGLRDRR